MSARVLLRWRHVAAVLAAAGALAAATVGAQPRPGNGSASKPRPGSGSGAPKPRSGDEETCLRELASHVASATGCRGLSLTKAVVVSLGSGAERRTLVLLRRGQAGSSSEAPRAKAAEAAANSGDSLKASEAIFACNGSGRCQPPGPPGQPSTTFWRFGLGGARPRILTYVPREGALFRLARETLGKVPRLDQAARGIKRDPALHRCLEGFAAGAEPPPLADLKACAGVEQVVLLGTQDKHGKPKPKLALVRRAPRPKDPPPTKKRRRRSIILPPPESLYECVELERGTTWVKTQLGRGAVRLLATDASLLRVGERTAPAATPQKP